MSQAIQHSRGAATFVKPERRASRISDAVVFSDPSRDICDPDWDAMIKTIESFDLLDDDWDGDQAVAPDATMVYMAIDLARKLRDTCCPAPARVVAGVNGTISFEFGDDLRTVIEVVSPDKAEVYEAGKMTGVICASAE